MDEIKSTHGGARAGAGRKKGSTTNNTGYKTGRIVISCLESDVELVKNLAQKQNKNISQFIIDLVKKV